MISNTFSFESPASILTVLLSKVPQAATENIKIDRNIFLDIGTNFLLCITLSEGAPGATRKVSRRAAPLLARLVRCFTLHVFSILAILATFALIPDFLIFALLPRYLF